jgi:hypothetical protein
MPGRQNSHPAPRLLWINSPRQNFVSIDVEDEEATSVVASASSDLAGSTIFRAYDSELAIDPLEQRSHGHGNTL